MSNTHPIHSLKIIYEAPAKFHWQECRGKIWWRLFSINSYIANAYVYTKSSTKDVVHFWTKYENMPHITSEGSKHLVIKDHERKQRAMIALVYQPNV